MLILLCKANKSTYKSLLISKNNDYFYLFLNMNYKNVVEEAVSDDDINFPRKKDENVFENIDEDELKDTIGELD